MRQRELFESSSTFRKENEVERIVRPVGKGNFHRNHAQFGERGESLAIDIRGGILFHPLRKIADTQSLDRCVGVEIEMAEDAGEIACSTSIASSTERVIGPSLSSDQQSVMAPVRGTRP